MKTVWIASPKNQKQIWGWIWFELDLHAVWTQHSKFHPRSLSDDTAELQVIPLAPFSSARKSISPAKIPDGNCTTKWWHGLPAGRPASHFARRVSHIPPCPAAFCRVHLSGNKDVYFCRCTDVFALRWLLVNQSRPLRTFEVAHVLSLSLFVWPHAAFPRPCLLKVPFSPSLSQGNKRLHQREPAHPPNQPHIADLQNRGLAFRHTAHTYTHTHTFIEVPWWSYSPDPYM